MIYLRENGERPNVCKYVIRVLNKVRKWLPEIIFEQRFEGGGGGRARNTDIWWKGILGGGNNKHKGLEMSVFFF